MLELAGNYSHRIAYAFAYRIAYKVDNPYLVTFLIGTPILEQYVVWCGSKNGPNTYIKKKHVFKQNWTTNPNYDNHSKFNSQDNSRDLFDHLMST